MDEGKKKQIMIALIVGCLLAAGIIAYINLPEGTKGINAIPKDETVWVKCTKCGAEYEMNHREFAQEVQDKMNGPYIQPITCQQCNEDGIYKAVKCEKCETVFFSGEKGTSYIDECPKCDYSPTKEKREKRRAEREAELQE